MKKIEKEMLSALNEKRNWKSGNTRVESRHDGEGGVETCVFLHGNKIFEAYENLSGCYERYFTLAGWNTNTTRSRLNALGVGVYQRNFAPMYKGKEIDAKSWYEV